MKTIEVRVITPDEITTVKNIFETVFAETFSSELPKFEDVTEGEKIYAAICDNRIVGFASVWEPDSFIHFLFVEADVRRLHVGSTLVRYIADCYGTLTLKCLTSNTNALAFYQASGWEQAGVGICEDGEYKLLRTTPFAQHPGNAPHYMPSTLEPNDNSPLAGKTIIFLGSSVTLGYASLDNSFADYLGAWDGVQVVKEAVSGTTLVNDSPDSYIPRMKTIATDIKADLFLCQLSTNDFHQGKDPKRILQAIEEIIDYARRTWHCPVMFYTSPRFDQPSYANAVASLKSTAKATGIGIIDLWSDDAFNAISEDERELYMFDSIHPTMAGYRLWWLPEMEQDIIDYLNTQKEH